MLGQGLSYDEIAEQLGLDHRQVLMCEESWHEIHSSFDYTPDDSRPREFSYEIDEVKAMLGPRVFEMVGDLSDAEIELLLLHVEGELETEEEKDKADTLLERLRSTISQTGPRG